MRAFVCTWRGERPNTSMWPLVGYNKPSSNLTVVDLPEPFGPSSPNTSPRRTSKSTLSTARALGRPQKSLKTLVNPRTEITISRGCSVAGGREIGETSIIANSLMGEVPQDLRQAGLVHFLISDFDHSFVKR